MNKQEPVPTQPDPAPAANAPEVIEETPAEVTEESTTKAHDEEPGVEKVEANIKETEEKKDE